MCMTLILYSFPLSLLLPSSSQLLSLLSSLMQECWRPNPWARLSALRVKKTIIKKGLEKFEYKNGFSNHTYYA